MTVPMEEWLTPCRWCAQPTTTPAESLSDVLAYVAYGVLCPACYRRQEEIRNAE